MRLRLCLYAFLAIIILGGMTLNVCAQGATVSTIHNFSGTDGTDAHALLLGADGNLLDAAEGGSGSCGTDPGKSDNVTVGCGVAFKLAPDGSYSVLHDFTGGADGAYPITLLQGGDGNLYGTTVEGGTRLCDTDPGQSDDVIIGCGTIYMITPTGTFQSVYSFAGANDGAYPDGLIQGSDGNFYSAALEGGSLGGGTLFRITPSGNISILYSFSGGGDGEYPTALLQASDGNFYGMTEWGTQGCPGTGCGTVFKMTPTGAFTTIYQFTGGSDGANIRHFFLPLRSNPVPPRNIHQDTGGGGSSGNNTLYSPALVEGLDGNLYGTTPSVDISTPIAGTFFRITTAGSLSTLYTFTGDGDGGGSLFGLFPGSDGNFYSTSGNVFFSITPAGTFTPVYTFSGQADGGLPWRFVPSTDGNFYGTAKSGGDLITCGGAGCGTVFKISTTPPLFPTVQLAMPSVVTVGSPVNIHWTVLNAFSTSEQQCYAFARGSNSSPGAWTGLQPGFLFSDGIYTGLSQFTAPAAGSYTYALTCGGQESGFGILNVSDLSIVTTNLPDGQLKTPYTGGLTASGGVQPYNWTIVSGSLPAGVSLQPSTGLLSGIPTQIGSSNFTVLVTDSAQTPATASVGLTLTVDGAAAVLSTGQLTFQAPGGLTSAAQTVTLTNPGTLPLTVSSISVSGSFSQTNNCGASLAAGSSCTIAVSFTPTAPGAQLGSLTILDNASGSVQTVVLSGTQTALQFVPMSPCRIADTRNAPGPFGSPGLAPQETRSFSVPQSTCPVPSSASAYALNITVVPQGGLDYLSVWPTGQAQPNVSLLNSPDGRVKAGATILPAGTGGAISVYAHADSKTQIIIDISGYFVPATGSSLEFYATTPCRVADTRNAAGPFGGPRLSGGQARAFAVQASDCQIPASAQAYSLNVTAIPHGPLNYLTIWPTAQTQPTVSTLNAVTGFVTANAASFLPEIAAKFPYSRPTMQMSFWM